MEQTSTRHSKSTIIQLADRGLFSGPLSAIFYVIPFRFSKSPAHAFVIVLTGLMLTVFGFFSDDELSRSIFLIVGFLTFSLVFLISFFLYSSVLLIEGDRFTLKFFFVKFGAGNISELREIQRIRTAKNTFRVRLPGAYEDSGFILLCSELPSLFSGLKVNDVDA